MIKTLKKYFHISHKIRAFEKERIFRKPDTVHLWNSVLFGSFIAFAISVAWHTYQFYKLQEQDFTKTYIESSVVNEKINENNLDAVLLKFENREKEFESLRAMAPVIVDPSV